jgi:predicted amidohydrolase
MTSKDLYSLSFKTTNDFESNLNKLLELLSKTNLHSISLAPEVCLTDFFYDDMQKASEFSQYAITKILPYTKDMIFATTFIERINEHYFNNLIIFDNQKIVYRQPKYKLFKLGDENRYFEAGKEENINIIEIDGLKIATLICFELRFSELWNKIRGADIIFVPAMWGGGRKDHYATLTKALAIANQAFVIASNSQNDNMAKSSAIIAPFGEELRSDDNCLLHLEADLNDIKKYRRYINLDL